MTLARTATIQGQCVTQITEKNVKTQRIVGVHRVVAVYNASKNFITVYIRTVSFLRLLSKSLNQL